MIGTSHPFHFALLKIRINGLDPPIACVRNTPRKTGLKLREQSFR